MTLTILNETTRPWITKEDVEALVKSHGDVFAFSNFAGWSYKMKELEWLATNNPSRMLDFIHHNYWKPRTEENLKKLARKCRLFGTACCELTGYRVHDNGKDIAECAGGAINLAFNWSRVEEGEGRPSYATRANLWRDIVDNPFKKNSIVRVNSTIVSLATAAYENKLHNGTLETSRMMILGDALEENGCDNADILNHLHDEKAIHIRGCWVLDMILGNN